MLTQFLQYLNVFIIILEENYLECEVFAVLTDSIAIHYFYVIKLICYKHNGQIALGVDTLWFLPLVVNH